MRCLRAVALSAALALLCALPAVAGPRVVLYMGLGDGLFAGPLMALAGDLRSRGARVEVRPWYAPAPGRWDAAIGQSAGTSTLDETNARRKIALDPTARFHPRQRVTRSFHTDGIGITVPHSPNTYVPAAGHVTLPLVVRRQVVALAMKGR